MEPNEALGVISTVCREYNGNLADHTRIQTALKKVAEYVDATAVVMASDQEDIEAQRKHDSLELEAYRKTDRDPTLVDKSPDAINGSVKVEDDKLKGPTKESKKRIMSAKDGDMVKVDHI